MSLNTPLGYSQLEPWLNAEEYTLLQTLDPKFKRRFDVQAELMNRDNFRTYMNDNPTQYDLAVPRDGAPATDMSGLDEVKTAEADEPIVGSGVNSQSGGFLQALIPFIPLIASIAGPLISKGLDGIMGLISKRGSGMARQMDGAGILQEFWGQNLPQLKQMEDHLGGLNGKQFWKSIHAFVKQNLHELVPRVANVSPAVAKHVVDMVVHKMLPKKFIGLVNKEKTGKGKGGRLDPASIVRPVVHHTLRCMLSNPESADAVYKKIKGEIGGAISPPNGGAIYPPNLMRGSGILSSMLPPPLGTLAGMFGLGEEQNMMFGSGFFDRLKSIVKSIIIKSLPAVSKIGEHAIGPVVDAILDKFGVKSDIGRKIAHEAGKQIVKVPELIHNSTKKGGETQDEIVAQGEEIDGCGEETEGAGVFSDMLKKNHVLKPATAWKSPDATLREEMAQSKKSPFGKGKCAPEKKGEGKKKNMTFKLAKMPK